MAPRTDFYPEASCKTPDPASANSVTQGPADRIDQVGQQTLQQLPPPCTSPQSIRPSATAAPTQYKIHCPLPKTSNILQKLRAIESSCEGTLLFYFITFLYQAYEQQPRQLNDANVSSSWVYWIATLVKLNRQDLAIKLHFLLTITEWSDASLAAREELYRQELLTYKQTSFSLFKEDLLRNYHDIIDPEQLYSDLIDVLIQHNPSELMLIPEVPDTAVSRQGLYECWRSTYPPSQWDVILLAKD